MKTAVELWEDVDRSDLSERQQETLDRAREAMHAEHAGEEPTGPDVTAFVPLGSAASPLPLFDAGVSLAEGAPDITDLVRRSAMALNRARHGADVEHNRAQAQDDAKVAAGRLQAYAGTRVSLSQSLAIVWHLVDLTAAVLDPAAAGR